MSLTTVSVCAIIALARGSWSEENVSIQLASSFPVAAGHKAKAHGSVTSNDPYSGR